MIFSWEYHGENERKLRSVLKSFGVTSSLMKVAIFHGGALFINGEPAWAVDKVMPGETVSILVPDEPANPKISAYPNDFEIAYEDRDFLVINKRAGVATVPAHNVPVQDSLVNQVKYYYCQNNYPNKVTHVATRLDKDTSGLVVFPKHRFAHAVLDNQLKHHLVKKDYIAVVRGRFDQNHGYVDAPIKRNPDSFVMRQVGNGGKDAVTEYWKPGECGDATIIKIRLHTGRTHQIRVHFSFLGHPLFGDDMYGGDLTNIERQALHCKRLQFYSPFQKRWICCNAELPVDIKQLIANKKESN